MKFPIPACYTAFESRRKHTILLGGLFSPPRPRATVPKCVLVRNKIVPGRMKRKREMAQMEQRKNNYCRAVKSVKEEDSTFQSTSPQNLSKLSCPPSQLEPLPLRGPGFEVLRKFLISACYTAFESRHKHTILLGGLFSPPRPRATVPKCVLKKKEIPSDAPAYFKSRRRAALIAGFNPFFNPLRAAPANQLGLARVNLSYLVGRQFSREQQQEGRPPTICRAVLLEKNQSPRKSLLKRGSKLSRALFTPGLSRGPLGS
ncbi:hypothetical protein CDAR_74191 [Caerostris darwini]|uniref:Uncharacterized protein n=1 Tax=Caerostris darwini TaxID=1538125 RepID=A0AAV4QCC1_9ARAC|nr:hypothetical protein CDAR_74191 [Caerostris darwini]